MSLNFVANTESKDHFEHYAECAKSTELLEAKIPCRWHKSASTVGLISQDGHNFTKTAGGQKAGKQKNIAGKRTRKPLGCPNLLG